MGYKTLLLLWLVCATVGQRCPPEEDLAPSCLCKEYDTFSMLNCNNIMSVEEIIPPIRATESYKIFSVNFEDSSLMYLPNDLFKFTNFEKIRFGNSQVMSLSDTDVAFEGLENTLEEIRATGAHYITTWEWSQLRNLKKLSLIDVNNIGMHSLDNEFPHLESLNALGISNAQISFLHPEAFSGLPNLKLLILKQNQLSEITRNMFPNPAKELHHLDLSDNLLRILPDNIFKNMPVLRELNLSRNKFVTLKEDIFSPVIRILQSLYLKGNAIRCDCRLKWMVNHPTPLYFEGECSEPESLKGDTLRYLKHSELYC